MFVCPCVHPFFSLSVLEVSSSPKVFQLYFKDVLKLKGKLKDVSRKFYGCLLKVSIVFPGSCKGVSRKFQECFKEVPGKFQGCFKKVPSKIKVNLQ